MIRRIARAPRHSEGGFTLVELLVVIVILGILSAVVVFAVRGVTDRGKANAVAIDERIIRTAEEAYCANNNRYADMGDEGQPGTLVGDQYLAGRSGYRDVKASNSSGPCNGWRYDLSASAIASKLACGDNATLWPPGQWCPTDDPPEKANLEQAALNNLLVLPDGRVLVAPTAVSSGQIRQMMMYAPPADPTTKGKGTWSADGVNTPTISIDNMVLLGNGKVLVTGWDGPQLFYLYDPAAPSWTLIKRTDKVGPRRQIMIPLKTQCGTDCGKVFVFGTRPDAGYEPSAKLYNPVDDSFEVLPYPTTDPANLQAWPGVLAAPVAGGVLLVGGYTTTNPITGLTTYLPLAQYYNAASRTFSNLSSQPSYDWNAVSSSLQQLPDGQIMLAGGNPKAEIYKPASGTQPASFRQVNDCGGLSVENKGTVGCALIAVLSNGGVLARTYKTGNPSDPQSNTGQTFLYNVTQDTWTRTGDMTPLAAAPGSAVLSNGRVLTAGSMKAQIYVP